MRPLKVNPGLGALTDQKFVVSKVGWIICCGIKALKLHAVLIAGSAYVIEKIVVIGLISFIEDDA